MIRDDGKGSALFHGLNALAALFGADEAEEPARGPARPQGPAGAKRPCNCTGRRSSLPPMPPVRKAR
jgi:hypothetical protein